MLSSFQFDDRKKIGVGLTAFGVIFFFLGILFFFDKGLLSMGNILFLSGVTTTIGGKATLRFFTKKRNYKGTGAFFAGFALVVIGWAMTGMLLETYGLLQLFRDFLPTAMPFLRKMPVIGYIFQIPAIKSFLTRWGAKDKLPV